MSSETEEITLNGVFSIYLEVLENRAQEQGIIESDND